jgi:hypothetical protein
MMSKPPADRAKIESYARSWTITALRTLGNIMINPGCKDCDRIRAAEILVNRGLGKLHEHISRWQFVSCWQFSAAPPVSKSTSKMHNFSPRRSDTRVENSNLWIRL